MRRIFKTWWPLAASWLLMGVELPTLSAVVARLPNPEINLAAYGGVVFPISLIVEAPIIMLLTASTALSKDWDSYLKLRRFTLRAVVFLTGLHLLIAFTPLFDLVVVSLLGVPSEIVEPARIGLRFMTPWAGSIAYRRFHQGVLIRSGYSRAVGLGTLIRLCADGTVLAVGYAVGTIPGIVVATGAVAAGVISEAAYAGLRVRPVLRDHIRQAPPLSEPLTFGDFMAFYIPLAVTALLNLAVNPLGSAAISRMPLALESLAVWPMVSGLLFMLRSTGFAYNEVVVARLDQPGEIHTLRRFATVLSLAVTLLLLIVAATPLSLFWLEKVSALKPELAQLARMGLWFAIPWPLLSVLQNYYQGILVHSKHTRSITEGVVVFLVVFVGLLWLSVSWGQIPGLFTGLASFVIADASRVIWLWLRSQSSRTKLRQFDAAGIPLESAEAAAR